MSTLFRIERTKWPLRSVDLAEGATEASQRSSPAACAVIPRETRKLLLCCRAPAGCAVDRLRPVDHHRGRKVRARKTEAKEDYHGDHRHLQDDRQQRVRALYLPNEWTDDPARLKAAHVPSDVGFATEPQIARRMVARPSPQRCRSRSRRWTACMAQVRSKPCCARREKAMIWGSYNHVFVPGASSSLSPAPPPRSRRAFPRRPGTARRPAKGPKVRAGRWSGDSRVGSGC